MVGDFFGSARQTVVRVIPSIGPSEVFTIPTPTESVAGRVKQAESYQPLPTDRYFLDYAAYKNVPLAPAVGTVFNDIDVQRFTPGLERTFLDGAMSVEIRMPVARTLNSTISFDESIDADHWEPGNLNVAVKSLLIETNQFALVSGLGIRTPTADDLVFHTNGTTFVVENESVHLLPYVGLVVNPNGTFFGQALVQVDVDTNGNTVLVDDVSQGQIQDQTFLFSSFSLGAWLYDDPYAESLSSVALTTEFHHSSTVSDVDVLNSPNIETVETAADNDFDSFTAVIGMHLLYAGGAQVTFAYGVPIGHDRFADGEFRTLLSRNY